MRRFARFILMTLVLLPAEGNAQGLSNVSAHDLLQARCPSAAEGLLRGFASPQRPSATEVKAACTCVAQDLAGKTWNLESELDKSAARALLDCAKPLAIAHSKRTLKPKFEYLFSSKGWTVQQAERFSDCAADRLWRDSIEIGRSGRRAQPSDVQSLVDDCSAVVTGS